MKHRVGFTIIEVSLFLGITGLLLVAVTIGVQNSVFQQRYNDSVQSFVEFLRSAYSETTNVQSIGDGRSNYSIYGKLVTFGETIDLNGHDVADSGENMIFSYDVVGNVSGDVGTGDVLGMLRALGGNVLIEKDGSVRLAGVAESYTPKWSARIQKTDSTDPFVGAILIIRHPRSGNVYTYTMSGTTVEVNKALRTTTGSTVKDVLGPYLNVRNTPHFSVAQIDFCVNPHDNSSSRRNRADVRLNEGARGSSAIETIYETGDNLCTK